MAANGGVLYKKGVLKIFAIFRTKHLCQGIILYCNFIKKEILTQEFSSEFCKMFKNTFFTEHLSMTASILQQLLALYFAIMYVLYIYIFFFFYFLWQIPVYFVSYAKRMLYSEQPTVLLAWRHLNTMVLINFENSNFIPNIFQQTHDFLVLMDPVKCIYLRTTDKHFRDQGNIRHPTSKWRKCDLVPTLNIFRNPSLRIFAAGKASLVSIVFAIEKKNVQYVEIFIT